MATKSKRGTLRVGALLILSGCFVVSALIRAGEVVAALPEGQDDGFGNPIAVPGQDKPVGQGADQVEARGPKELLAELDRQRARLQARDAALKAREKQLKSLEQRLRTRLQQLREAQETLKKTAATVDNAAGKDVERLASMYQQMKPKQAGQIFNKMAPSFAAGFLSEMRPDAAALILANMDADKAYAVSLMIAGRNVNKPTLEDLSQQETNAGAATE